MSAIGDHLTTEEILSEIGARLRARRLDRNTTVDDAATTAGVNRKTLIELERGGDVRLSTLVKIMRHMNLLVALEAAFPDMLPGTEGLSKRGQPRQRAAGNARARKKLLLL